MNLVVVGLDGASFELIDPWIGEGELPNIAKIKKEGVWANMSSVLPPVTSPNWKCYSTGKNPGKLGVFWWQNIDWRNGKVYYPVTRMSENKEVWDYMGEEGLRVGIVGMPTTYPPKKVNGFLIAGCEAGDRNFTYPEALEEELNRAGWRNLPRASIELDRNEASQEIHEIIDKHFRLASNLGERYHVDFLNITVFPINILQHYLWDAPETKAGWRIIDEHLGKILNTGCDLIIMSDHGSNRIECVFNINTWLEHEGYLNLNLGLMRMLYKLGINQQSMMRFLSKLRMLELARRILPSAVRQALPDASGEIKREAKASKIDWQRSKALASGQGPIYLNPLLDSHDSEALRREIKQKLEALTDPATGKRIIESVYSRDEIYEGKYLAEAPDLIMDQAKGVHIPGGIVQREMFAPPQRWQAENKKVGWLMAYGPNIKRREKIDNVSILDLAPTILHLMDIPIPEDMDGRVLKEIFRKDSKPANRAITSRKLEVGEAGKVKRKTESLKRQRQISKEEDEKVKERLRTLGYLD